MRADSVTVIRQTRHFECDMDSRRYVARTIFGLGLLIVSCAWANLMAAEVADRSDFLVTSWHTENGLPHGNVTALEQTPDGYLWVGTFRGLARFDGLRFTAFGAEQGTAILAERIAALAVDQKGRLWVGGESGALAWLENGQFHTAALSGATTGEDSKSPLAEKRRASGGSTHSRQLNSLGLVEDGSGTMWFQTRKPGLIRVKNGQCEVLTETNGLPPGRIFAVIADKERQPWLLAGDWLCRLKGTEWMREAQSGGLGEAQSVLSPGRSGGLWIAEPKGAWLTGGQVVRYQEGRATQELEPTPWAQDSPRSQVTALLEDHTGRLWLGMHWGGVFSSQPGGHWQRLRSEGPLAQCRVNCLFEDRQGCVWVGTLGDGLFRITRRVVSTVHLPETANEHLINTVSAGPEGSVWVGTDGAGVFRLRDGAITHFGAEEGLGSPLIFSILADRRTNVWCGTSAGLFRLHDGRFEPVAGLVGQGVLVLALFEDRSGRLWIGTAQGPVCLSGGEVKLNRLHSGGGDEIRCFAEDQESGIWVGTVGRGLFCLRSNRVEHFGPAEG
jgi:ligand-binding sensor domain-containing protein